jgi:hypothetical protein
MEGYNVMSWQDYWNLFDKLIELLKMDNQADIVMEFKDAQKYVNGLTDGWYEFMTAFEKSATTHKKSLTDEQISISHFLIEILRNRYFM